MTDNLDRLVWVDTETTGLETGHDLLLEVGMIITYLDLKVIDIRETCIWDSPHYDVWMEKNNVSAYVQDMHESSGLFAAAREGGLSVEEADEFFSDWLDGYGVHREPMCGSSVQFDRGQLNHWFSATGEENSYFSYRNIDVSSIKELCMRYNPDLYAKLDEAAPRSGSHRVVSDLFDTINEFRFYRDEFLIWEQ